MKKLELSAYGVEEMNSQEMKSVDGGSRWGLLERFGRWLYRITRDTVAFKVLTSGGRSVIDAHGQIINEGGTTAGNCIGFK